VVVSSGLTVPAPGIRLGLLDLPAVNFINIKRVNFLYARRFSSYVLALSKNSYVKR
jgi:hypothetical protein